MLECENVKCGKKYIEHSTGSVEVKVYGTPEHKNNFCSGICMMKFFDSAKDILMILKHSGGEISSEDLEAEFNMLKDMEGGKKQ